MAELSLYFFTVDTSLLETSNALRKCVYKRPDYFLKKCTPNIAVLCVHTKLEKIVSSHALTDSTPLMLCKDKNVGIDYHVNSGAKSSVLK